MDDPLSLETPEQIEVRYDIARLGSRFIAALWDTAAIGTLLLMASLAGGLLVEALELGGAVATNWAIAIITLLVFVLFWGYYVIFELTMNGQTPGKRLASIRTVRADGYPIGFAESAIRNLVRIADLLPAAYGFGMVVMFLDRRSRRLGDFAAGTLVVHDRPAAALSALRPAAPDPRLLEPPLPNLERLSADEVEAARRFLQRRATLTNSDRLAAQLAARFRERLEGVEPTMPDVELLQRIVAQRGR